MHKMFGRGDAQVHALRGLDLVVGPGTSTAIMGPSGSGKSTLLSLLAGLDRPDRGEVTLDGVAISRLDDDELTTLRRDRVGFVFQSFNLLPELTARENVELPLRLAGRPVDAAEVARLADALGIADRLDHRPDQLSGGQAQRVAVVRALITHPAVILADEPTGALDRASSEQLLTAFDEAVRAWGQTLVVVTHDPAIAARADRVVILVDGRLVRDLERPGPAEIIAAVEPPEAVS